MEENKVAQKLRDVLEEVWRPMRGSRDQYMEDLAEAILQSPDLRVTLVIHPTPIAEMIEGLRRNALLSPSESVILDILERMNHD